MGAELVLLGKLLGIEVIHRFEEDPATVCVSWESGVFGQVFEGIEFGDIGTARRPVGALHVNCGHVTRWRKVVGAPMGVGGTLFFRGGIFVELHQLLCGWLVLGKTSLIVGLGLV